MAVPRPIDPRGPRFNQAVLATALLIGFVLDWRWVIPVGAVVLAAGAFLGPQYGPFLRLYADVIKPRLRPPAHLEDPRPPRFAAAVGTVFLTLGSVALLVGVPAVAWALALIVAGLAAFAAATGICVGCQVWLFAARRRRIELAA
jgi:hypothetical protein